MLVALIAATPPTIAAVQEDTRADAWGKLTDAFRRSDKVGSYSMYEDHFRQYRQVIVGEIHDKGDNKFAAQLTYVYPGDQRVGPNKVQFRLTCDFWMDKLPLVQCEPEDLQIDETETYRT